jgi:hypothetical protein
MFHWLQYLIQKSSNYSDKDGQTDLVRLCSLIITDQMTAGAKAKSFLYGRRNESNRLLGMVVIVSLRLRDLTMLGNALSAVTTRLPSETYVQIGKAIHLFDFQQIHKVHVLPS